MDVGHMPTQGSPPPARYLTTALRCASYLATMGRSRWATNSSARLAGGLCPWPPPMNSGPWGDHFATVLRFLGPPC